MKDIVTVAYRNKGRFALDGIRHTHIGDYELLQIFGGGGRVVVGNMSFPMCDGGLYLINASNLHFALPKDYSGYERNAIRFSGRLLSALLSLAGVDCRDVPLGIHTPLAEDRARMADAAFRALSESYADRSEGMKGLSLLVFLLSMIFDKSTKRQTERIGVNGVNEAVIEYLSANYRDRITLDMLSREFNLSKYHLCRTFKRQMGMTVFEYLNAYRLAEVKKLLVSTDAPITEIAFSQGFDSYNYFSSYFKRAEGVSPRDFRRAQRQKENTV